MSDHNCIQHNRIIAEQHNNSNNNNRITQYNSRTVTVEQENRIREQQHKNSNSIQQQ